MRLEQVRGHVVRADSTVGAARTRVWAIIEMDHHVHAHGRVVARHVRAELQNERVLLLIFVI